MAKLIFIGEKFGGRTYEITAQRTTVGRSDANTLSIHDGSVSEQHCEIYDNGEDLIIHDLGSRNGTVVNGELLHNAQRPLAQGQIVKFGAIEARLEIPQRSATSDTVTDVTAVHFHAHNKATPPVPSPAATLDAGQPHDSNDHTLVLPRPSPPPPPASAQPRNQVSAPQTNRIWIMILVALALGALVWWIFRR